MTPDKNRLEEIHAKRRKLQAEMGEFHASSKKANPTLGGCGCLIVVAAILVAVGLSAFGVINKRAKPSSVTGDANIVVVQSGSACEEEPSVAQIHVEIVLRNDGTTSGTVGVIPVRRYDDGTTNASFLDEIESTSIPPGQTRTVSGLYNYDAVSHDLIQCWARLDGDEQDQVPIRIFID